MTLEKVVSWIAVIGFVAAVVWAYANLNNRLENIERSIGSAACNAILPRQIEAIEKNRKEAREALEKLSAQYDCGPRRDGDTPATWAVDFDNGPVNAIDTSLGPELNATQLSAELNEIDRQLEEDPFKNR